MSESGNTPQNSNQEIDTPDFKRVPKKPIFKGRKQIFSDAEKIDETNVVEEVDNAISWHYGNRAQIQYLWDYYRGIQPILHRVKDVRPEINNKIVENHAQEIVAFKIGYQLAEPLQYTCRTYDDVDGAGENGENPAVTQVNALNTMMFAEDKDSCDRDLFEWMCVAGQGYRMTQADREEDVEDGGAPFEIYSLDPRNAFIVYSSAYHHKPLMAVWIGQDVTSTKVSYSVFTEDKFFHIVDGVITNGEGKGEATTYGCIPIVEYKLNNARMGVFEPVLPLLDAINALESNRLDGIEQTVQALIKFVNCSINETEFREMLKLGAVEVSTTEGAIGSADVDVIKTELDQSGTQITKDDLYQSLVKICGMPNRSGKGGSTSDTGAAVLLRDGWTLAEAHAKGYELQFKRAERDFLRAVLNICDQKKGVDLDLRLRDIELTFNRRNYENILVKSQVLTTMLTCGQIHPQLAFEACGLFTDPEAAYLQSRDYEKEEPKNITKPVDKPIGSQALVPEPGDNAAGAADS